MSGRPWRESCDWCGWPLVPHPEPGCWDGNCSMRPLPELTPAQHQVLELKQEIRKLERERHQVNHSAPVGWIAMAEREPERSGEYLIWDGEEYEVGRWNDGDFYRLNGMEPPTHWMPLPEPPSAFELLAANHSPGETP